MSPRRLRKPSPVRLRVRELREVQGLTGADLARRAGVRPSTISAIENQQTKGIDFETLDRLAVALGVDAAMLVVHKRGITREPAQ